ncbi:hypothetical protein RhiirC2_777807 [Rhizophagus irregularis]|uniref:DUF659 domain-containing protein n=1 Tax=Rhizophagus irregularis TaxID=588596 RepID=A0A2N1NDL9_9GLOM|nr:hypothetical protein RhiirC2_777807 [Rhizophagus irregularis]
MSGILFNVIENHSLWNNYYNITTPERKEYLVALSNYSTESRTGKFLTSEISAIIEKIGVNKFAAVVTDTHAINLMAAADDLVKLDNIKDLILDCGKITRFFNNSHQASAILFQDLKM